MDRREHLKLLLTGTIGAGFIFTQCTEEDRQISEEIIENGGGYGRTPEEVERDERLHAQTFFTDEEFQMVDLLSEIIIPADENSGGASDAGVADFIEFMVKDIPSLQLPMRGGLMWLNGECRKRFGNSFLECSETERMEMIDEIAWPDDARPEMAYGVRFFNRMRNLTSSGYFTSQIGIDYLGYMGNRPVFWDGVPEEVLNQYGLSYDERTIEESINAENRHEVAEWDEDGNLIR